MNSNEQAVKIAADKHLSASQAGFGQMIMDADMHYIGQGIDRPMTGGIFHDWIPIA